MNLLEALARKLKNDWTGGASGDPGRYHAPGAFEDFRIADLFNNDRWTREPMVDPNSSSGFLENRDGTPRYTSYYKPRGAVDVTETDKIGDKTVVTKYKVAPEKTNYEVFPYDPGSSVTSELYNPTPYNTGGGSGARVSDPMNTRPGTFIGSLHHPPNIAGMGSRVAPGLISQGAYKTQPGFEQHVDWRSGSFPVAWPQKTGMSYDPTGGSLSPFDVNALATEQGRAWKVYTSLKEAGFSEEDARRATVIFFNSGGDREYLSQLLEGDY